MQAAQQPSPPNAALLPTAPEVHALLTKILKAVKRFLATNTSVRSAPAAWGPVNACAQPEPGLNVSPAPAPEILCSLSPRSSLSM